MNYEQIRNFFNGEDKRDRMIEVGKIIKKRGKPSKKQRWDTSISRNVWILENKRHDYHGRCNTLQKRDL